MRSLKQRGYVLHEVLLAAAILVPLGVYALRSQSASLEEARGVQNAERTQDFTELALNYYRANATGILAAMADGAGADQLCRLNVTPGATTPADTGIQANNTSLHTCAIDVSVLKWKGFAPATFPDFNLQQQRMVVVFRRLYDTTVAPAVPTDNVELLSIGASGAAGITDYAPNAVGFTGSIDPLVRDARAMGASGGVIPDEDRVLCKWVESDPTQREACGAQGGWRVKLSDFIG